MGMGPDTPLSATSALSSLFPLGNVEYIQVYGNGPFAVK